MNDGAGGLGRLQYFEAGVEVAANAVQPSSLRVADLNGDGRLDIVVGHGKSCSTCPAAGNSSEITVMLNLGADETPTISQIPDQTIVVNTSGEAAFTISDQQTSANQLTLSRTSTDGTLLPTSNIEFTGSGTNRVVRFTPAADRTGSST